MAQICIVPNCGWTTMDSTVDKCAEHFMAGRKWIVDYRARTASGSWIKTKSDVVMAATKEDAVRKFEEILGRQMRVGGWAVDWFVYDAVEVF